MGRTYLSYFVVLFLGLTFNSTQPQKEKEMDKKYKGFDIWFEEKEDCFLAYKDGERFAKNQSLQQLKNYLDISLKKSFSRLPIYWEREYDEITEGEITSFNSCEKKVWITYGKEKSREKVSLSWGISHLVHRTSNNLKLLQQIYSLESQAGKLIKEREKLKKKLTRYSYEELCKLTGENPIN